ncbi:MAG: NUDIX hydrolase [Vampirovibrio sp.]|nr:NUDIX hydrolase [Vampirovibrio sp.]
MTVMPPSTTVSTPLPAPLTPIRPQVSQGLIPLQQRQQALKQHIWQLSQQRDVVVRQQNAQILAAARELGALEGRPVHVPLGDFQFRRLMAMPFGPTGVWEYMESKLGSQGVVIVPVVYQNGRDHFVFILNHPASLNGQPCVSFPAGYMGDHASQETESVVQAAQRELMEETGFQAQYLKPVDSVTYGSSNERNLAHFVLAKGLRPVQQDLRDEAEKFAGLKAVTVPVDEVYAWLNAQKQAGYQVEVAVPAGLHAYFLNN